MVTRYQARSSRNQSRFRLTRDYDSPLDAAKDNGYTTPDQVNRFRRANQNTYRYTRGGFMNRPKQEESKRDVPNLGPAPWQPEPREKPPSSYKFNAPIPGVPFTESPSAEDFTYRNQLPIDYYRYFYGDVSRRQVQMRESERRRNLMFNQRAQQDQEQEQAAYQEQLAEAERGQQIAAARGSGDRRFQTGQYGARFDEGNDRRLEQGQYGARFGENEFRDINLGGQIPYSPAALRSARSGREAIDAFRNPFPSGERRFSEGQYGERFAQEELPDLPDLGDGLGEGQLIKNESLYTPQWVEPWLDARDPNEPLTEEEIYMLELIGYYEPTDYAGAASYGGGGGGYSYPRYGGGGGGGGGGYSYTPSNYRPASQQARGPNSLGLVSWRI